MNESKKRTKKLTCKFSKLGTGSGGGSRAVFTASTAELDRDGDRIPPSAWRLENYRRNPVVLYGHDHTGHPVGKATEVRVIGDALRVVVEFPPEDVSPEGFRVSKLVEAGFLGAVSVGFRPVKYAPNGLGGFDFEEVELLEVSIVTVPANPSALIAAGFDGASVKWYAEHGPAAEEVSDLDAARAIVKAITEDPEMSGEEVAAAIVDAFGGDVEVSATEAAAAMLAAVLGGEADPEVDEAEAVEAVAAAIAEARAEVV